MKYFDELKKSMEFLAKNKKTIFIGQAVEVPGTAMSNTLIDIKKNKKFELPVAEEMQMGMTIGMLMAGQIPVSIFPRWNFLLLAINQLVNHLDKFTLMNGRGYKSKAIIRTSIGSERPLHPQFSMLEIIVILLKQCVHGYILSNFRTQKIFLKNTRKL